LKQRVMLKYVKIQTLSSAERQSSRAAASNDVKRIRKLNREQFETWRKIF